METLRSSANLTKALPRFNTGVAYELYAKLFGSMEPELRSVRTLFVVPDLPVWGLPFPALVTAPPEAQEWEPGYKWQPAWLLDEHQVVIAPTVPSLAPLWMNAGRSRSRASFLGLGDPTVESDASGQPKPLLPGARQEIEAAAALFDPAHVKVLLGPQFALENLESLETQDYRIILFATHTRVGSDGVPYLQLSQAKGALDLPALTAEEAVMLHFDADLVVLSGCSTGESENLKETSFLSAFLAAGGRAVMATYWPLASESAHLLTTPVVRAAARGGWEPWARRYTPQ